MMKSNRVIHLLLLVMLIGLSVIGAPAPPALAAVPSITLMPPQGSIGQTITISGTGFYGAEAGEDNPRGVNLLFGKAPVYITGTNLDYTNSVYERLPGNPVELSSGSFGTGVTKKTFTVPAKLTNGNVDVTAGTYYVYLTYWFPTLSDGPTVILTAQFTVVTPAITISPNNGLVGTEVNIDGSYFGNSEAITVKYDGNSITATGDLDTNTTGAFGVTKLTIPASRAGEHTITITGATSGASAQAKFTVKPNLVIAPTSGAAGTTITATGSGFGGQVNVNTTFGGDAAPAVITDANGSFSLNFPAPPKAAGSYTVTAADSGGNSAGASFELTQATVILGAAKGQTGEQVAISGSKFLPNQAITISFNNIQISTAISDAQGNFSGSFAVPEFGAGEYIVKASDGANFGQASFEISVSADINPRTSAADPGRVGSLITITGDGFTPGETVIVRYDSAQVTTATVQTNRAFTATFTVPASKAGNHTIVATDGLNTQQFIFVMESAPPPTPPQMLPEAGTRASSKTRFDWQDVTDPSGVTYTLQIASDAAFSAPLVDKKGLTTSEYELTAAEKLESKGKESPYYWRVSAVDGAENQSQWSAASAFYVGGLSLSQPVLYVLIILAVLVVFLFAFWLGRRTAYY